VLKDNTEGKGDFIEHYVILLSAQQLVQQLRRENIEFWREHALDSKRLQEQLRITEILRGHLISRDPVEMPAFLDWFDRWFLQRATPLATEAS
jgi:hypothetical protein